MPPRDPHLHPLLPRLLSVPLPANSLPDANLPRLSPLAGLAPACPENSPRSNISSLATPIGNPAWHGALRGFLLRQPLSCLSYFTTKEPIVEKTIPLTKGTKLCTLFTCIAKGTTGVAKELGLRYTACDCLPPLNSRAQRNRKPKTNSACSSTNSPCQTTTLSYHNAA